MRPIALNVLLLIASVVLVVLGLEGALRLVSPFPSFKSEAIGAYPDQYDEFLGWAGIPNLDILLTLREFRISLVNNAAGFRDDAFEPKLERSRREEKKRVMLLGDSFAWGWGVEKDERVGELISASSNHLTIFNLAQSGYGTDQEYLVFGKWVDRIDPDLVILMFFRNDFDDVNSTAHVIGQAKPIFVLREEVLREDVLGKDIPRRDDLESDVLEMKNSPVPYNKTFWETKTQMARVFGIQEFENFKAYRRGRRPDTQRNRIESVLEKSHARNWLVFRWDQLSEWIQAPTSQEPSPRQRERSLHAVENQLRKKSQVVFKLLNEIKRRTKARGAEFLVVMVPDKGQVIGTIERTLWQEVLLGGCRKYQIDCLDLLPFFAGRNETYWRIDPHWNANGHRLAAELITQQLEERAWLTPR